MEEAEADGVLDDPPLELAGVDVDIGPELGPGVADEDPGEVHYYEVYMFENNSFEVEADIFCRSSKHFL